MSNRSFSITKKLVIDPINNWRKPIAVGASRWKKLEHFAKSEVATRILAATSSIFASFDLTYHLFSGHKKQAKKFAKIMLIGSIAGAVWPGLFKQFSDKKASSSGLDDNSEDSNSVESNSVDDSQDDFEDPIVVDSDLDVDIEDEVEEPKDIDSDLDVGIEDAVEQDPIENIEEFFEDIEEDSDGLVDLGDLSPKLKNNRAPIELKHLVKMAINNENISELLKVYLEEIESIGFENKKYKQMGHFVRVFSTDLPQFTSIRKVFAERVWQVPEMKNSYRAWDYHSSKSSNSKVQWEARRDLSAVADTDSKKNAILSEAVLFHGTKNIETFTSILATQVNVDFKGMNAGAFASTSPENGYGPYYFCFRSEVSFSSEPMSGFVNNSSGWNKSRWKDTPRTSSYDQRNGYWVGLSEPIVPTEINLAYIIVDTGELERDSSSSTPKSKEEIAKIAYDLKGRDIPVFTMQEFNDYRKQVDYNIQVPKLWPQDKRTSGKAFRHASDV